MIAYQALQRICEFYNSDTELKGISSNERIQKRQELIKLIVEEIYRLIMERNKSFLRLFCISYDECI